MTTPKSKADALEALADYAALSEIDRIDALTPEEVRAELAANGVVPASEEPAPVSGPNVAPPHVASAVDAAPPRPPQGNVLAFPSRTRRLAPFAFALVAGALALVAARALHVWDKPHVAGPTPNPTLSVPIPTTTAPTPDPLRVAADLRTRARADCDKRAWADCLDALKQASTLDPAGDDTPEVNALRQKAEDALESKTKTR